MVEVIKAQDTKIQAGSVGTAARWWSRFEFTWPKAGTKHIDHKTGLLQQSEWKSHVWVESYGGWEVSGCMLTSWYLTAQWIN